MEHILYIHGFLSSPKSFKAQQVREWVELYRPELEYHCPSLNPYPSETHSKLQSIVESSLPDPVYLIGSSLGGYWATWFAEKYNLRAVLVNPAVRPSMLNPDYVGVELKNYYSNDTYMLNKQHIDDLLSFDIKDIKNHDNFWLMVQTGDETLDYRLAVEKYKKSRQLVEQGGDHSFINFKNRIPDIIKFLLGK